MSTRSSTAAACLLIAGLAVLNPRTSAASAADALTLNGSVRLPDLGGQTMGRARIVRALTPDELAAAMPFSVALRMRDFAGLQARIAAGEQIPFAEMEARYLPLRSDYDRVSAWLSGQGFTQTLPDRVHMNVFVKGPVAGIARAFGVQFARVAVADGEYSSAISAPSVPAELAPVVLCVAGLQPEFRARRVSADALPVPRDLVGGDVYVTPDNVASAYNIPATATGAGQIIAIVGEAPVETSDLTTFWRTTDVAQVASNVVTINVQGGPAANPDSTIVFETCLDVEWASAMAPAAQIRLYLSQNSTDCFAQILDDLPSYPNMTVISTSYGNTEANDNGYLQSFSQVAATFAAAGVSILASSGDSGSNPDASIASGEYEASAPLGVSYPASDPSVTGVGGTTVDYTGNWDYTGEVVWNQISDTSDPSASGGGVSSFFAKPTWQTGGSVLAAQSKRCVPDVAAISDGLCTNVNLGASYLPFSGTLGVLIFDTGTATPASGTSLSCPVWAAVAALINQARATSGLGPIGLLNPHLYPLVGSSAFHDITSGNNGAYSAGPGYDLCTGLGSPNVANLLAALAGTAPPQRLANISSRAEVETGANILIAGFVIQGPAGTSKNILVRGIGPALAAFSVSGALANPIVGVYDSSSTLIASDTGWSNAPAAGTSTVAATFREATVADMATAGAFSLTAGSADSAMVLTLPVGSYTVQVSGAASTTGIALAEVYELDTTAPEVLENISSRSFVGTGAEAAIPGFVVEGSERAQLLIRGVGPGLDQFGLTGTLAQPTISVYDQSNVLIVSDTGWGNAPVAGTSTVAATFRQATAADMQSVGAFALTAGSADSAIVVTLPPGNYTAVVSGVGGTTGTGLAEVYEIN
jgi:kumamolisin